jgi:hypothetical protein
VRFYHNFCNAVNAVHYDYDLGELPATLETLSVPEEYEQRHQLQIGASHSERLILNEHKGYQEQMHMLLDMLAQLTADPETVALSSATAAAAAAAIGAATALLAEISVSLEHESTSLFFFLSSAVHIQQRTLAASKLVKTVVQCRLGVHLRGRFCILDRSRAVATHFLKSTMAISMRVCLSEYYVFVESIICSGTRPRSISRYLHMYIL